MYADSKAEKTARVHAALTPASIPRPKISRWSVIAIVASLVAIYFLLPQLTQFRGSIPIIEHADLWWVAAALIMSALSFFAAGYTQYVAGNYIGSFGKITILQLTGAFINHFLPFNMGSSGLTARYYWTLGKSKTAAIALSVTPIAFSVLMNIATIAVVSPVTLSHIRQHYFGGQSAAWLLASAGVVLAVLLLIPPLRRRVEVIIHEAINSFTNIKLRTQLPGLLFGSLALTVTLATALLFSVHAAHASISANDAFTIFVTQAVVQNLAPTPGGIGASEAFLVFGMTSVGIGLDQAIAATLIFRFVSFWIPIIPGMLALHTAGRWKLPTAQEPVGVES